jgi:cadmium resistance protein CadD (predicted permease)
MSITIEKELRSYYLGVFYGTCSAASVFGSLTTAFLLEFIPPWVVILILALVCLCGNIPLFLLEDIDSKESEPEEEDNSASNIPEYRPPIRRVLPIFGYTGVFIGWSVGLFPTFIGETVGSDLLIKVALTTTFVSLG